MVNNWATGCVESTRKLFFSITCIVITLFAAQFNASAYQLEKNVSKAIDLKIVKIALPSEPFHNTDNKKQFAQMISFLKEYWQIWAIDSRKSVEFIHLDPYELTAALRDGRADIAAVTVYNPRQKDLLFSLSYANYKQYIFKRLNKTNQSPLRLATHNTHSHEENFIPSYFQSDFYNDIKELIANHKNYDALYSHQPKLLSQMLVKENLLKDFYVSSNEIAPVYLRFASHKKNRNLMYMVNDGIRRVNNEQVKAWNKKYPPSQDNLLVITLGHYIQNLSEEEKQYIIDNIEVKYPITEKALPPYVISKNDLSLSESGLAIDLLKITQEKMGPIFTPYYVKDKEAAINTILSNKTDLLIHREQEINNSDLFNVTSPYLKSHYEVIYRQHYDLGKKFRRLNKETIAVVANSKTSRLVKSTYPNAKILTVNSPEEAILAVSSTQAYAYIGHSLTNGYFIKQKKLFNLIRQPIEYLGPAPKLSFATYSENEILTTLINRSFASITQGQFDDLYAKWNTTPFSENQAQEDINRVYRNASFILGGLVLFGILIFFIYYRQLQMRELSRKRIENELKQAEEARELAEQSAQEKITFLARMSHEIRTPMNGVFGMAEALSFTDLNTHQQELLGTLRSSAGNLMALLNDVLDFSKMDAGKLTLESVPVNLHQLTRNVINSLKSVTPPELMLESHVDDRITHNYLTDPTRLTQVLNNLLSNAIKFTENGTVSLTFHIEKTENMENVLTDTIRISVKDTGIGIPIEHQDSLFTPFKQADDQITRKFGGTGLGLSICQEIVTSMDSSIQLESSAGIGSHFHFTLALIQSGVESDTEDRRKNKRVINPPNDNRFQHLKVLVAEDNLVNLKVLTAQLERLHIYADIAEDGEQALILHEQNSYDIIISDCHMPKVDGFELASTVSKQERTKPIWLIAITADALSGAAENCINAGFNDYMSKPCPQEVITNKLNNAYRQLLEQQKEHTT